MLTNDPPPPNYRECSEQDCVLEGKICIKRPNMDKGYWYYVMVCYDRYTGHRCGSFNQNTWQPCDPAKDKD